MPNQSTEIYQGSPRWTARGTHLGSFVCILPSCNKAALTGTTMYRSTDENVAECRTNADDVGLLPQLGALSPAGTPA